MVMHYVVTCLHAIGAVVLATYRSLHLVIILLQYDVFTLRMHDTMTAACMRCKRRGDLQCPCMHALR